MSGQGMLIFRMFMVLLLVAIVAYTGVTVANEGFGLVEIFFGDIAKFGWPGQFNFDFMLLLILIAFWVAWRHQYSPGGLLLAAVASVGGVLFLSTYLLVLSVQTRGDAKQMLLGSR